MKKLLLVTLFALCLPLASYALMCPSKGVLNNIIHSKNFNPGSFKTAGFDVPWFVKYSFPYKHSTVTRFDSVSVPIAAFPWTRVISCLYNYESDNGMPPFWFEIDNYQPDSQFVGTSGKWYGQTMYVCLGTKASECQFKRDDT